MTTEEIKLEVTSRSGVGTTKAKNLRREGLLPGTVYGEGREPQPVSLNLKAFGKMLSDQTSENVVLDLSVDGAATEKVLIKEIQHHPLTHGMLHVDFHKINMKKTIRIEVPVHVLGDAIGVANGGNLEIHVRTVDIECLPTDVIESWDYDISNLDIGDFISVGDKEYDESTCTLHTAKDIHVATVHKPRVAEDDEVAEEDEADTATEPEVIGEKAEEEEA